MGDLASGHHVVFMATATFLSKIATRSPRFLTIVGIAFAAQLFAGAALANPACHKTAVCLMKKAEKKPVEARTATPSAPCSHKTAVCKRVSQEPKAREARAAQATPASTLCSHKTAVCLRTQQEQKAKQAAATR